MTEHTEVEPLYDDTTAPGIPQDVEYIRDPLDRMVALLGDIREGQKRGQDPAPTRITFPFVQAVRFRAEWLVLTSTVAAVVTVQVGSAAFFSFPFAVADTKIIPFPVTFDRGVDHALTTTAGVASGFVTGYADEA